MGITFPNNTVEIIDGIRYAIGRMVTFYKIATTIPCPVCNLDPITNTSTDSFCPVCSGVFWLYTYSGVSVSGHVNWGQADQLNWATGGQIFEGDCRVQIKYTVANLDLVDNTKWLVVDGKKMSILKVIPRGVKPLNRILLDLREEGKEG